MIDAREVTQVEDVVELGGGWGQLLDNAAVQLQGTISEAAGQMLQTCQAQEYT